MSIFEFTYKHYSIKIESQNPDSIQFLAKLNPIIDSLQLFINKIKVEHRFFTCEDKLIQKLIDNEYDYIDTIELKISITQSKQTVYEIEFISNQLITSKCLFRFRFEDILILLSKQDPFVIIGNTCIESRAMSSIRLLLYFEILQFLLRNKSKKQIKFDKNLHVFQNFPPDLQDQFLKTIRAKSHFSYRILDRLLIIKLVFKYFDIPKRNELIELLGFSFQKEEILDNALLINKESSFVLYPLLSHDNFNAYKSKFISRKPHLNYFDNLSLNEIIFTVNMDNYIADERMHFVDSINNFYYQIYQKKIIGPIQKIEISNYDRSKLLEHCESFSTIIIEQNACCELIEAERIHFDKDQLRFRINQHEISQDEVFRLAESHHQFLEYEPNKYLFLKHTSHLNDVAFLKDLRVGNNDPARKFMLQHYYYKRRDDERDEILKLTAHFDSNKLHLYPFQKYGSAWILYHYLHRLPAILADDMGLGKTRQIIAFLKYVHEMKRILILSPLSVLHHWYQELSSVFSKREIAVNCVDLQSSISIINFHRIEKIHEIFTRNWDILIVDEAQFIKNSETNRFQKICKIRAVFKIASTGTPIENSLTDLWSLFHFINPNILGKKSDFSKAYSLAISNYLKKADFLSATERYEELRTKLTPFILHRKKEDLKQCIELPPKQIFDIYYDLTESQRELIENCKKRRYENRDKNQAIFLQIILRMKQICNHPIFYDAQSSEDYRESGKMIVLIEIIYKILANNEKLVIFSQFNECIDYIFRLIKKEFSHNSLILNGNINLRERERIIERFNGSMNESIFILNTLAGGTGINLHSANHLIHFDHWWNPAVERQASDRIYRIGQDKTVYIYKLIGKNSIEEKIEEIMQRKKELMDALIVSEKEILRALIDYIKY